MSYGTIKVDTITFTDNSVDKSVSLSGLIQNPTFTGNITVTGTISGDVIRGGTTVSGATVTGTTANFVSGVFTTQISGATVTGTTASFTSGVFTTISGTTATITSGIIASGTAAAPSLAILADLDTGLFSPGANQLAVATNGVQRLLIQSTGLTVNGTTTLNGTTLSLGAEGGANGFINTPESLYFNIDSNNNETGKAFIFAHNATDSTGTELFRIQDDGKVGIGTSSPSTLLHLSGLNSGGGSANTIRVTDTDTAVITDQICGRIEFETADTGNPGVNCQIDALYSGSGGGSKLQFRTGFAGALVDALHISDTGLVGIGTTSPDANLDVRGSNASILISDSGRTQYWRIQNNETNDALVFNANDTSERMRIDSSGRLLVGTSTARSNFFNGPDTAGFQLEGTGATNRFSAQIYGNGSVTGPYQIFAKHGGIAVGSTTLVSSGDEIGGLSFQGSDGTEFVEGARITAYVDGTPGANDMPGRLVFSTTADGASSPTERLRITSAGLVGIGTSSPGEPLNVLGGGSTTSTVNFTGGATGNDNATIASDYSLHFQIDANNNIGGRTYVWRYGGKGYNDGTPLMKLDASGRLGIGTESPDAELDVNGRIYLAEGNELAWHNGAGAQAARIYGSSTDELRFDIGSTASRALTIDSSGRLLVGTSTSRNVGGSAAGSFQIEVSGTKRCATFVRNGGASIVSLGATGATGIGNTTIVADGDPLGSIEFAGADGTDVQTTGASILVNVDGTPGANDMPGRIVFSTNPGSPATVPTERMRITSAGLVGIGTTDMPSDTNLTVLGNFQSGFYRNVTSGNRGYFLNLGAKTSGGFADGASIFGVVESGDSAGYLTLGTRTSGSVTEKARIDSSGRLLVGTSTGYGFTTAVFAGNGAGDGPTGPGTIALSRGIAAPSLSSGSALGHINFTDNAGAKFASINGFTDGTAGSGDYPGRLVFSTTADGASSPTERMRLSQDGRFYLSGGWYTNITTANAANVHAVSSGEFYRSTSSIKYKTDIETLQDSYADAILNVRPVWYRSLGGNDNPDHSWWGFIAEEVAEIDPRLVQWKTVDVTYDENGSPVQTPCEPEPEGVAYDRFVPHLLNLIKRQGEAIADLQAEVAALKAS
jgi:hypothetical protein